MEIGYLRYNGFINFPTFVFVCAKISISFFRKNFFLLLALDVEKLLFPRENFRSICMLMAIWQPKKGVADECELKIIVFRGGNLWSFSSQVVQIKKFFNFAISAFRVIHERDSLLELLSGDTHAMPIAILFSSLIEHFLDPSDPRPNYIRRTIMLIKTKLLQLLAKSLCSPDMERSNSHNSYQRRSHLTMSQASSRNRIKIKFPAWWNILSFHYVRRERSP